MRRMSSKGGKRKRTTSYKGSRKSSRKFRSVKRRRIGRRSVRGRTGGVNALIRRYKARSSGVGRKGPADRYIYTQPTVAETIKPDLSFIGVAALWGYGPRVGKILTQIRDESPFTLVGGNYLYQPSVKVYGFSTIDLAAVGNSAIDFEFVIYTTYGNVVTSPLTQGNNFQATWLQSFDNSSTTTTGFPYYPDTSLLENYRFWDKQSNNQIKPLRRFRVRVPVGRPKRLVFKFATRVFKFEDYSQGTWLTTGFASNKTFGFFYKAQGELGQVCATNVTDDVTPLLSNVAAPFLLKVREHYFYRFVPGNNRPTVYGSNCAEGDQISDTANTFVGVPALKSQRYSTGVLPVIPDYPNFGAWDRFAHHEAQLNFPLGCADDIWEPTVLQGA